MENNLVLHKEITFTELVKHGLDNGANINNGVPWSWKINGKSVTHENDDCYIIETIKGNQRFQKGDKLMAYESGLHILHFNINDTHSPGGCPM